ncbi:MAG TPA: ABC transporter ATP-binding protein [Candidatus Polarisedimenticolia bacterium]|nr:ABC transporter ATP-binding protein [Candidatus Polarisedimenticolia bacterium]
MPAAAIVAENLEKYFPPALSGWKALLHPFARATECALAGVSFEVGRGEAVAILGHNGAGKSTLLRILATLIVPTRGRAILGGFDAERESSRARHQLGYHTGGDEGFYSRLSGRENLAFFAAMNNLTGPDARDRIASVTAWMGISDDLDRQVRTYSTGMTHRLGLARALLHGPAVLLLDEPTRSLDPLAAADFRRLLKDELVRRRGTTLLFASHVLGEVEEIADRIILLDRGKLIACDSPSRLRASTGATTLEGAIARLVRPARAAEAVR